MTNFEKLQESVAMWLEYHANNYSRYSHWEDDIEMYDPELGEDDPEVEVFEEMIKAWNDEMDAWEAELTKSKTKWYVVDETGWHLIKYGAVTEVKELK